MKAWPRCISCGRLLYSPRTLKLLFNDAMCCSHECELLWQNYFAWRAEFRENTKHFIVPKFPFFRSPRDRSVIEDE